MYCPRLCVQVLFSNKVTRSGGVRTKAPPRAVFSTRHNATRVPKGIFQLVRLYWIALGARGNTRNTGIMDCSVTRLSRRIRGDYISRRIRPQSLMTGRFDGFESPASVQGGSRRWQFHLQISAEPRPRIRRTEEDPFNKGNKPQTTFVCCMLNFVRTEWNKMFVTDERYTFDLMEMHVSCKIDLWLWISKPGIELLDVNNEDTDELMQSSRWEPSSNEDLIKP